MKQPIKVSFKNQLNKKIQLSAGQSEHTIAPDQGVEVYIQEGDCLYIDHMNVTAMAASLEHILTSEYNEEFDRLRKNRMVMSFYKYGPVKENYNKVSTDGAALVDAVKSLKLRLNEYLRTGNTEFLVDVANFAMIEYMYPQHSGAHFKATDDAASPGLVGTCVNELKQR